MSEQIILVELNYEVSPITIREHLSSRRQEIEHYISATLKGRVFIVATCHRFSFLALLSHEQELIRPLQTLVPELRSQHLLILRDTLAVKHWFATACGLNSRTIGEHEILGQIRNAFRNRTDLRPELNELVKRAIHTGKRARTETSIGRYATSLTAITKDRIQLTYEDTRLLRVMIFGTGEMSKLVLQMLKSLPLSNIYLVSKDKVRAAELCTEANMIPVSSDQFHGSLMEVDIVIGATWTENFVVSASDLEGETKQLFIDLGMPRNFDPAIKLRPKVTLFDLTDLNETAAFARQKRTEEIQHVNEIIFQEAIDLDQWMKFRSLIPEIRSLRAEVDALRDKSCYRIKTEQYYLSGREKNRLCYQIRGLTQQHFSKILAVLKSDASQGQKVTTKLEVLHDLYAAVNDIFDYLQIHQMSLPT